MKHKKLIVSILVFLTVFIIYITCNDKRMNYIALGDSLAIGENPYGKVDYGYADYIANYLDRNNLLKFYTKGFAESGDKIQDLLDDINNNKTIQIDDKIINIKASLRESDLVTISIGANDFIAGFTLNNIIDNLGQNDLKSKVDQILPKLNEVFKEVRKYAKNEIIVLGYYNPLPRLTEGQYDKEIDELFAYADKQYQKLCDKYKIKYLSVYESFKNHDDYLPNPINIHPNTKGYEVMSNKVIDYLEKNVIN